MNKTAEQCVQSILRDVERRKAVDFGDRNSVRRYNAAMDRIYENGRHIDTNYPEKLHLLVELLYHSEIKVVLTTATLVQKLLNTTKEQKMEAIEVIRNLLDKDVLSPAERLGCTVNIEAWEKELCAVVDQE